MEFKDRLRSLRKEHNLTQTKLGEMLNYGYTAIANYESGRNQPSIPDLKKIASIFNVSMDYLLGVSDLRRPFTVDEETAQFNEFQRYYALLNEESKEDLMLFMEFLLDKETRTKEHVCVEYGELEPQSAVLRVAQKTDDYR